MSTATATAVATTIRFGRRRRLRRRAIVCGGLTALLVALAGAMLMLGNTIYPASDVVAVLLGEDVPGASFTVGTLRVLRHENHQFDDLPAAAEHARSHLRRPLPTPGSSGEGCARAHA